MSLMAVHGEKARCERRPRESSAFSEAWETNSRKRLQRSVRGAPTRVPMTAAPVHELSATDPLQDPRCLGLAV